MTEQTTTQAPNGVGPSRTQSQPASSGVASGQYQMVTADIGQPLSPGGMRGIGLLAFMAAQIALKIETLDLAKEYYKTNKRDFDFFKATHQPGMHSTASEAMSPIYNPSYQPDLYASAPAGLSTAKAVDRKWFEARRRAGRYNVGVHSRMDYDFALLRAAAVASGWNMGRRYEISWADAHNERAYNRKLAAANMGIQAGNTMRQGLATAVGNLQSAYTGIGDSVMSVGNGYYKKAGYDDARSQVRARYGQATPAKDYEK